MKIRTRVKIAGTVAVCVFLAFGAGVLHLDRTMSDLAQEIKETNEIVNKISLLRNLTQDYLLYRTERAQRQWSALYAEVSRLLESSQYREIKREYGLGDASQKLKIVGDTFSRLMTIQHTPVTSVSEEGSSVELQSRLATQLLLATQDLLTRFFNLNEEVNQKFIRTQRFMSLLDILALLALGSIIVSAGIFLQRSVVKPILKLHDGAEIIGAGNLDYQVGIDSPGEIGELTRAFDRMTANLREITVSRDELIREIEERNRAEARTAAILDSISDSFFALDRDMVVTYYNRASEKVLGRKAEDVVGKNLFDAFPEARGSIFEEKYSEALRTGEPTAFEIYFDVPPLENWYDVRVYPFGQGLSIYFRVTTERKLAEEKLQATLLDLERSNRDLEEFAYISSHDLQEPLRKIANFSEMLGELYRGRFDEDADRYFGYIADGAKRMQALINDLLAYSRLGRADMTMLPASLEDILRGTLNDLQSLLTESGAQITHDPLPTLEVNSFQMGQLLQNLIANAIKFRGGQPLRIHLSAKRDGGRWVFAIRDNGIGFDSQYAERIFKVFQSLHARDKYPGTGIGLAICKKIVEQHGGCIWAESQPGRGSTFYFTIPV